MKHAREDYNGRVVDLCEPRIVTAITEAVAVLELLADPLAGTEGATGPTREQAQAARERLTELYAFHEGSDFGDIKAIPDEEPVFLLRGQDNVAAPVVRHWASKYSVQVGRDANLAASALAHADRMANWPVQKVADA